MNDSSEPGAGSTAGFDRQIISVNGIDTALWSIGSGPTVVFLHGGGTFMGFEWARDLAGEFRLLLPHHPNFGDSGPADFGTTTEYAEHYLRAFDLLGLERILLAGASMGAGIAVDIAALAPERIERLALVTPAGLISPSVPPPDFSGIAPEDVPGYFVRDREFIEPFWPRDPSPEFAALLARERAAAARLRDFSEKGNARVRALARQIRAPTLLLWGAADQVLRVGLLDQWRLEMPDAEVSVIDAGSHMLLEEFPAARAALAGFLRDRS